MNLFELWILGLIVLILVILGLFVTMISLIVNDTSSTHEKQSHQMKVLTASTVAALVFVALAVIRSLFVG